MKLAILACYSVAVVYYCVSVLTDKDRRNTTRLDLFIACFPPTACVLGVIGLQFLPNANLISKCYWILWLAGIAACVWEFHNAKEKTQMTWPIVIGIGGSIMAFVVGPGFYFGYQWIRLNL